jgi:hypothetical protein
VLPGWGIPTVILPAVNAALAARVPFRRALADLRGEGIRVLSGPDDGWEPHRPGAGPDIRASSPRASSVSACQGLHLITT